MLSDITSADGRTMLTEIIHGQRPQFRYSSLQWPDYPRPTNWSVWRMYLQHITSGVYLIKPLGEWIEESHQRWEWFYLASTDQLVHACQNSTKLYSRLPHTSSYPNRRNRIKYGNPIDLEDPPSTEPLLPATVQTNHNSYICSSYSNTAIPLPPIQTVQTIWNPANIPPPLHDTSTFYQHLIRKEIPTLHQCGSLCEAIQDKSLIICSDEAHCPSDGSGSHAWIFHNLSGEIAIGAGPMDGHPSLTSSYRAELGGILVSLYLIYKVCQYYRIEHGQAQLFCDNRGAISKAFQHSTLGITPFLTTDFDLLHLIQQLIQALPITANGSWVKGHYSGKIRRLEHDLNDMADDLATQHLNSPSLGFHPKRLPLTPPGFKV